MHTSEPMSPFKPVTKIRFFIGEILCGESSYDAHGGENVQSNSELT